MPSGKKKKKATRETVAASSNEKPAGPASDAPMSTPVNENLAQVEAQKTISTTATAPIASNGADEKSKNNPITTPESPVAQEENQVINGELASTASILVPEVSSSEEPKQDSDTCKASDQPDAATAVDSSVCVQTAADACNESAVAHDAVSDAVSTLLLDGEAIGRAVAAAVCAEEEAQLVSSSREELEALIVDIESKLAKASACLEAKVVQRQSSSAFLPPSASPVIASYEGAPLDCTAIAAAAIAKAEMLPSDPCRLEKVIGDTEAALAQAKAALQRKQAAHPSEVGQGSKATPAAAACVPAASAAAEEQPLPFSTTLLTIAAVAILGGTLLVLNRLRRSK